MTTPAESVRNRTAAAVGYWSAIHAKKATPHAEAEPEPALTAEDIELADWAEKRTALGLGRYDSDFVGIAGGDQSGMPDWRHPTMPEEVVISAMDEARADRPAASVNSSDFFGVQAVNPRSAASPWRAV